MEGAERDRVGEERARKSSACEVCLRSETSEARKDTHKERDGGNGKVVTGRLLIARDLPEKSRGRKENKCAVDFFFLFPTEQKRLSYSARDRRRADIFLENAMRPG